jgi:AcrR family transcriptional regulator
MTGKRLSKEERRQQLLQVARSIIRTQGVKALTLGYLAEQAGITKPIAYRHFIDREGLLISIYQEFDDKQTAELNRSKAAKQKPYSKPFIFLRCLFKLFYLNGSRGWIGHCCFVW